MELKGQVGGVRVYDSYAHHPNEIAGDLQAARSLAGEGRVVVAFQPHMVSRTRIFGHDMGVALGAADEVVVMDIYVAREDPEPGVTGALVADAVPLDPAHVVFEPSWSAVAGAPRRACPAGRHRAHARRGRRDPARPRGARAARGAGGAPMSMRERLRRGKSRDDRPSRRPRPRPPPSTGPDEETVRIARKDFRRRRNAGRWRTLRLVLLALLVVAVVAASVWVVFFSSYVTARDVEVTGTTTLGDGRIERRGRRPHRHPARARRPRRDPCPRGVDRGREERRGLAQLAAHRAHRRHRAHPDRGDQPGRRASRRSTTEGVLFGHYATRPKRLPLVIAPPDTADEALVEGGRVIGSLPAGSPRGSTPSRSPAWTRSSWCWATAAGCCGGAPRTPARRPRCSPYSCAGRASRSTSPSRAAPPPADLPSP